MRRLERDYSRTSTPTHLHPTALSFYSGIKTKQTKTKTNKQKKQKNNKTNKQTNKKKKTQQILRWAFANLTTSVRKDKPSKTN